MKTRRPDRQLMADLLGLLRDTRQTIPGRDLVRFLGAGRLRAISEAARELHLKGIAVVYVPGRGYRYGDRAERLACAARMRKAGLAQLQAAAALERGRSRQARIPATRTMRAA